MYLEGFDKKNLSIGVFSGNIMLENMLVKANVFQHLGLPFRLVFGKLKKLHIKVPWTKLQSAPVELVLETLMLVVSPVNQSEWRAKETWNFEYKRKQIEEITGLMVAKLRHSLQSGKSSVSGQPAKEEGFFDMMGIKILDNIQLTIKNIHIRYEVDQQPGSPQYALGFTLQELGINTTNQDWQKTYYDRSQQENKDKPLFKRLSITGLALYLHHEYIGNQQVVIGNAGNHDQPISQIGFEFSNLGMPGKKSAQHYIMVPSSNDFVKHEFILLNKEANQAVIESHMQSMFPQGALKVQGVPYFIEPIQLDVRFTQLTKTDPDKPLFQFDVKLDELNISLSKRQYELLFQLADQFKQYIKFIEKFNMKKKYKYLRPVYPIYFESSVPGFKPVTFQSEMKSLSEFKKKQQQQQADLDASQLEFDSFFSQMNSDRRLAEEEEDKEAGEDSEEYFDALSFKSQRSKSLSIQRPIKNVYAQQWWRFAIFSVIKENRFKRGFWNEFKLTNWRKKEYAKHFLRVTYPKLTPENHIEMTKIGIEDQMLLKHIYEANDVADIQSWLALVLKRKLQKEQTAELAQQKLKEQSSGGGIFGFFSKKPAPIQQVQFDDSNKIQDDLQITEEEIEQLEHTLKQLMADSSVEKGTSGSIGLTEQQLSKQVKFSLNFLFKRGKINLIEPKGHRVELYQDELTVNLAFRRDTSFEVMIGNRNVGVNVFNTLTGQVKELIVKHIVEEEEEKKEEISNLQWELKVVKHGTLEAGFFTDIVFESNPIKMKYDASAFSKLAKFFETGSNQELKEQAYNKISALKESTQSSLRDLLYKKSSNLSIKIASPILELPFQAHNADYVGDVSEADRQRMWIINLGNIDFKNYIKMQPNGEIVLDEYERFSLHIDSIGLKYLKNGQSLNCLKELEIGLDIGIKNKIKAALIQGEAHEDIQVSPEVVVRAQLPEIILNASPDVYNGLVNITQVLMSEGQEEHLKKLKMEKDHIIENSYYINEDLSTRGLKGQLSSNWTPSFLVISGSYLYFYKNKRDLMPQHYIYLGECQISSQKDVKEVIQHKQVMQKAAEVVANSLMLKQRSGEIVYLKFVTEIDVKDFTEIIVRAQQDLQGEVNVLQKNEILSDIIHKDKNEIGFMLTMDVGAVEMRIWQSTESAIRDQERPSENQEMWLCAKVQDMKFSLVKHQYEKKLKFVLSSISITEHLRNQEEMLINEPGQNLCEIDIDDYDLYSPNIQDSEIIVSVKFSKLYLMFDPIMINETFKFFRNTKSYLVVDVESLNVKLMDESEDLIDRMKKKNDLLVGGKQFKKIFSHEETCKTVDLILIKVNVEVNGLTLITLHHEYLTPVFDLTVGKFIFGYHMHYDHDVIQGDCSNARAYDLTNYPHTMDPSTTKKGSLKDVKDLKRQEIIGIRDQDEEVKGEGEVIGNGIHFGTILYTDKCPLHKPGITSSLTVDIASVKIAYYFEMSFRIIDYFFDKFLWAITESDPYLKVDNQGKKIIETLPIHLMSTEEIEAIDMKQERNTMEMVIRIRKPYLLIKDRPYFHTNIEIDLGEITIGYDEVMVQQRFKKAPKKEILQAKFIIDCKDVSFRYSRDQFLVAPSFDLSVQFCYLTNSPLLPMIDSHELDKYFEIFIGFTPHLNLKLREDIYTFILRCVDLNFAYTDYLDDKFNFRNDEEYFRSVDYLLKSRTVISTDYIALSLITKGGEQLTEVGLKKANIIIDYHLNKRQNYIIQVEEMSSYYLGTGDQKLLLFGNLRQIHTIENFEDMMACVCYNEFQNPSRILVSIQMLPDGTKNFIIEIGGIKLFLHPYFYLMMDHFFRQGMPVYDKASFDKPNEYNEDFEECPEMDVQVKLNDSLICFANTEVGEEYSSLGIVCQANMDMQFKREKIKNQKASLWQKVEYVSSMVNRTQQDPIQVPISWIRFAFTQISPYICDLQQLEQLNFSEIKKRQLIQHFDTTYNIAKFIQFRWQEEKLFCYDKQEMKADKLLAKVSLKDTQLLQKIFAQFSAGYDRFNIFYSSYLRSKKQSEVGKELGDKGNGLFQRTQKAINMFKSMSIAKASPSMSGSSFARSVIGSDINGGQMIQFMDVPQSHDAKLAAKDKFLRQKLDYEAESEISQTKINSQGIQVVLINDTKGAFYPVLTLNLSHFEYKTTGDFGIITGKAMLKGMISYYNSSLSEWEPLIEKTQVEFISNHARGQVFHLIQFKKNFNLNLTTDFLQIAMLTQASMKENAKAEEEQKSLQQHVQQALARQSVVTGRAFNQNEINASVLTRQTSKGNTAQEVKAEIEYKVTPYTIVNYSSRIIFVKSVYYMPGDTKMREYIIPPGERAEYEVDYDEEVKHLMRDKNEEVVKKQDFLNVNFEGGFMGIRDINLRNQNFYIHKLQEGNPEDFVSYGVKFESMRKQLIIRAPYCFNNLTDVQYKMKLLSPDGKQQLGVITLEPGQCYPIDLKEMQYKFQLSNEFTGDEWSSPIRIRTVVEKVPLKATTFLYHGKQYTIINKEKTEHPSNFNINFKTPVIIKNALPCNLKIKTDVIIGKLTYQPQSQIPMMSKDEDNFEFDQREFEIERGDSLKLHNFNLKSKLEFLFTLDSNVSQKSTEVIRGSQQALKEVGYSGQQSNFQWTEFLAGNNEFKIEKMFLLKDSENREAPPLEVWASLKKCKEAGVKIIFFVKNVIVNNTNQNLKIFYPPRKNKILPAAGQTVSDNSIIMFSDTTSVCACLDNFDGTRVYSPFFNVDLAGVTNTLQIKLKEGEGLHEFTLKTELSRACPEESEIFTKVTTISPCYVLHNKTSKTLLITQEDCLDQCQIVLAGQRVPWFWKDPKKKRLVQIKMIEREAAEYDDDSHEWTFSFGLNEVGRMSIINRNKRQIVKPKNLLVDKQLQDENQILFITFYEEFPKFPTYKIENHSKFISIEYHQKDYPHNTNVLMPDQNAIFSWTNPTNVDYKITCKFFTQGSSNSGKDGQLSQIDLEPDNLELNERYELPPHLCQGRKSRILHIFSITNGHSKILRFSDVSQAIEERKAQHARDEELTESQESLEIKTFRLEVLSIGVSLICQTYTEKRKEFAFIYMEDLKFVVLEAEQQRELQLRIGYTQIDNNISQKPIFQVMAYPKELYMKRDKIKVKKQEDDVEIKEFFNMHIMTKLDSSQVLFVEEIEFLLQTLVLQIDDEFIGYIYRFTEALNTNITGVHDIFLKKDNFSLEFVSDEFPLEHLEQLVPEDEDFLQPQNMQTIIFEHNVEEEKGEEESVLPVQGSFMVKGDDVLDQLIKKTSANVRMKLMQQMNKDQDRGTGRVGLEAPSQSTYSQRTTPRKMTVGTTRRETITTSQMNRFSQQHSQSWLNYNIESKGKRIYIKNYKSSPIDIELSYVTKIKTEIADQANKKFSVIDRVRSYGLNLVNLDRVQIRINSLELANIFGTPNDIRTQLNNHYITRMKQNILGIFGQTFLGSPANFISHLGTGAKDFFYMPINGLIQGPLEGGKGVLLGTKSLFKNTVQGTFGSVSKVFSQVSKGMLLITSDGEYINKREKNSIQDRPSNVIEGVGYGLKSTFKGIASGITGVVEKPISGAQKDGVKGFMKGFYKGISGLVVKPVSGALDLLSKTSEGIKNNVNSAQEKKVKRIRYIRPFYGQMQLIKGYNELHSEVLHKLQKVEKKRFTILNFLDAIIYTELGERKQKIVIFTEELVLIIDVVTWDVIKIIASVQLMTGTIDKNNTLVIHAVDDQQDLYEALRMKIDDQKALKRYHKIIQSFIYHIRTDMVNRQQKRKALTQAK